MGWIGASLAGGDASILFGDRLEAAHEGLLEERRSALSSLSDPFGVPQVARRVAEQSGDSLRANLPWKRNITATVFWVGEQPSENNPTTNVKSAWDQNWQGSFGGYDHPENRDGFAPAGFAPRLNPFYVALPYNDIGKDGRHRPEASEVIPWFWRSYRGDNVSVCKGRWLAIHHAGRVCYAQWEDVGPFETDHFQYVFGSEAPRPNLNQAAGIDLSPAVRDFLNLRSGATVEWRFAEDYEIPAGPWKSWSDPSANR
ncbi:hypothetical protein OVA24_09455 [Luteolibacter sp. SL250]|uniref:hypothetical protein n=1 Tax=Luteolibacter sp. SL250 TaxID=2995170 RepID=UPI00226DAC86|nr:hypothetical protein [Luteolibacter sp. SL250]WAC21609.1 hypothetical protein OVA24_09455 [Luteolibacter sp. SL250]